MSVENESLKESCDTLQKTLDNFPKKKPDELKDKDFGDLLSDMLNPNVSAFDINLKEKK